jgi:hypothetical protein
MRLAVLTALACALAVPASAAAPRLAVADDAPFTVHGSGFVAR